MRSNTPRRRGIIMVVVLGMLTLFTLLVVSYLVFASNARQSANELAQQAAGVDHEAFIDFTLLQALRGSRDSSSAFMGHDILGDYYGYRGQIDPKQFSYESAPNPAVCMPPTNSLYTAPRFHLENNADHRFISVATMLYSMVDLKLDDSLNGRILSFTEGPLKGLSMPILRYFGDHQGSPSQVLTGRVYLDAGEYLGDPIEIDDRVETLETWLASPLLVGLFYDKGADRTIGTSDDVPYQFYINSAPLNGYGMGWAFQNKQVGAPVTEYNLNQEIRHVRKVDGPSSNLGGNAAVALFGNYGLYRQGTIDDLFTDFPNISAALPREAVGGDADEGFDVADYNNLFLAYFPFDGNVPFDFGVPAPSFVRPAVIRYVLNYYGASLNTLSTAQLQEVFQLLRMSTPRPLPWRNASLLETTNGNLGFSSPNPNLATPVDFARADAADRLRRMARALIEGPWDVDTDGDGVEDAIWIDVGLPVLTKDDGTQVKPMAALRIEDFGGRVDLNYAGGHHLDAVVQSSMVSPASLVPPRLQGAIAARSTGNAPTPAPVNPDIGEVLQLHQGLGFGPADISLQGLFPRSAQTIFARRMGADGVPGLKGTSMGLPANDDLMGAFRSPGRPTTHSLLNRYGMPLDVWGRGRVALGPYGGPIIDGVSDGVALDRFPGVFASESSNDPYEMNGRNVAHPDQPYSLESNDAFLNRFRETADAGTDRLMSILLDNELDPDTTNQFRMPTLANKIRRGFTLRSGALEVPPNRLHAEWRDTSQVQFSSNIIPGSFPSFKTTWSQQDKG